MAQAQAGRVDGTIHSYETTPLCIMMLFIVMLYGLSYVHIISVSAFPIRYTHNIIQRLEQQQQLKLKAHKNDVDVSNNERRIENWI